MEGDKGATAFREKPFEIIGGEMPVGFARKKTEAFSLR